VQSAFKFLSEFESEAPENDYRRRELNRAVDSKGNKQQASRSYSSTDCSPRLDYHLNDRDDFEPECSPQCRTPFKYDRFAHPPFGANH
jgi:hypothetical protein